MTRPRAWRGGPPVADRTSLRSETERTYAPDTERMAHIEAGQWCASCGTHVRAGGIHAWDCPDVPPDRRAPRGA